MPIQNMTKAEKLRALKGLRVQAEAIHAIERQWMEAVGNMMGSRFHTRMYAESALANEIKYLENYPDTNPTPEELEQFLDLMKPTNLEDSDGES